MKDITLGQYIPGNSCIHKLDPRTKLFAMVLYIICVFICASLPLFLLPLIFSAVILIFAKIPVKYLYTSLRPIRLLLVFMFLLNLFIIGGDTILISFGFIRITQEALRQAVYITLRLILLVSGSSILTLTTSPLQLTSGLEKVLSPLKKVHFPAHELAMMMTIALRFIPTLMEETEKIQKAQMARGADFESGNPISRARAMLPILIPLFVSAFRRADELAMAMESRCYHGGEGRTKLHELSFSKRDRIAFAVCFIFLLLIIYLNKVIPVI